MRRAFLLLLTALLPLVANAYDAKINGIYYNFKGNEAEVTYQMSLDSSPWYISDYSGSVVIPTTVTYNGRTYTVTSIGGYAFRDCSGLTSVTIGNTVTSIGSYAFYHCSSLTSVTIPNGVTSIDNSTFNGCNSLTSISIPNSVTSIGYDAFYKCSGLTSVTIPNSVTSIGGGAFRGCSSLTSIAIPNSVTDIGYSVFEGCSGLTSITIPNSVTSIGWGAFSGTAWYNNQPNGLVYAGKVAYTYKGTMPDGTQIVLKDGTLGIAGGAFEACTSLTSITIPNSVTSIGWSAFSGCSSLTSVHINDISAWCNIRFAATSDGDPSNPLYYAHHLYLNGVEIKDLVIPNDVTNIGERAFYGCSGLTSVTL